MLRRFWSLQSKWVRAIFIFCFVAIASGAIYVKTYATYLLSPGELSTMESEDVILGGVKSHAELESQCSHCHAPIHCVTDTRCQDCHYEIEQDRMDTDTIHGALPGISKCQTCHPEHQGSDSDLTTFAFPNIDHYAMTGFSIEAHITNKDGKEFTCTTCHTKVRDIIETIDCVDCHSETNHDELAIHIEEFGLACFECHDGQDRMINGFDHEPFFSLSNGHEDLTCLDCHANKTYVGISTSCNSCHEEPELHAGVFGTNCEYCHTDAGWSPAILTKHTFEFQHGDEEVTTCETCHGGNYTDYPCATCHEDQEMVSTHAEVGFNEIQDCVSCHPTGRGKASIPGQQMISNNASSNTTPQSTLSIPIFMQQPTERPVQLQNQGPFNATP